MDITYIPMARGFLVQPTRAGAAAVDHHGPHASLDGSTPDQAYFSPLPFRMAA